MPTEHLLTVFQHIADAYLIIFAVMHAANRLLGLQFDAPVQRGNHHEG